MRRGHWRRSRLLWISSLALALALAGCGRGSQTDAATTNDVGGDGGNPSSDGQDAPLDKGAEASSDVGADGLDAGGGDTNPEAGDGGADVPSVAEPPVDAAAMDRGEIAADSAADRAPDAADAPIDSTGDRVDGPSDAAANVDRVYADAFDTGYPSIKVAQIAVGWDDVFARMDDGTVRAWGSNYQNALGFAKTSTYELRPVVVPNLTGVIDIEAAEMSFGCALLTGDNGVCWGNNNQGQLGDGTMSIRAAATPIVDLVGPLELVTGGWFACARLMDSTMKCWGDNGYGQLGFSTLGADVMQPTAVPGMTGVTQMAAGQSHTCVLLADRTVSCWGLNSAGELGDSTMLSRYQPMPVPGLSDVVQVAADYTGSCALVASGAVWCWGFNRDGEVGDGSMAEQQLVPARALGISDAVRIAAGDTHNCALLRNGTVMCWGNNRYGQLGDGTTASHPTPEPVMAIGDAVDIDARGPNTCVILSDRSVRCWGWGTSGQLGNGGTANSPIPVEPAW